MELSRRGMLGGLAAVGAVGVAGFAGAASVTDDAGDGATGGDGTESGDSAEGGDSAESGDDDAGSVAVDPDAPFEAQLFVDDESTADDAAGDDEVELFDAADLARVEGPFADGDEHLVYAALGDAGIEAFQTRLDDAGAVDDPSGFVVVMTLDGTEVRRVALDRPTVDALTDDEWGGVLTLPFEKESVAADVYESLAA